MNKPAKWFALGGLLIISLIFTMVHAEGPTSHPSMEFLEFLGDWETDDGQWIDPIDLLQDSTKESDQEYESTREVNEPLTDMGPDMNREIPLFPDRKGSSHE